MRSKIALLKMHNAAHVPKAYACQAMYSFVHVSTLLQSQSMAWLIFAAHLAMLQAHVLAAHLGRQTSRKATCGCQTCKVLRCLQSSWAQHQLRLVCATFCRQKLRQVCEGCLRLGRQTRILRQ